MCRSVNIKRNCIDLISTGCIKHTSGLRPRVACVQGRFRPWVQYMRGLVFEVMVHLVSAVSVSKRTRQ